MKTTKEEYAVLCKQALPHSPVAKDCAWAFCVGGAICVLGQILLDAYGALGFEKADARGR